MIFSNLLVMTISLIVLISCCLALLINKFAIMKKILLPLIAISAMVLLIFVYMSFVTSPFSKKHGTLTYKIDRLYVRNDVGVPFAFSVAEMSQIFAERKYHCGILRRYEPVDVIPVFPELKSKELESHVVLWAYELNLKDAKQQGDILEIYGDKGELNTIYYTLVPVNLLEGVSTVFSDTKD